MISDLPADNPTRVRLTPLMALISEAYRLSVVNRTLGTNLTSLSELPIDFVEAVIVWGSRSNDG